MKQAWLPTCKLGFKTIEFCSKKLAALGHWGRAEGPHLGKFSALQQRGRAEGPHLENFGPCGSGAGPKARTGGGVGPLQGQGPKASTPSTTAKPGRIAHPGRVPDSYTHFAIGHQKHLPGGACGGPRGQKGCPGGACGGPRHPKHYLARRRLRRA